jgi:hypothetical protein
MTESKSVPAHELSADEIAHVSGGSGLVGPGAGKEGESGGGGTLGSGT